MCFLSSFSSTCCCTYCHFLLSSVLGAGSYSYDMSSSSSLPYQTSTAHWNPVISAPIKTSIVTTTNHYHQNDAQPIQPFSSSSSASSSSNSCWDWLLYPPEIYSYLYVPSSSFIQQQQTHFQDNYLELSASLPTWLLALLYPSVKQFHLVDDENESDQEISSLSSSKTKTPTKISSDESSKPIHVSSNSSLASEHSVPNGQKSQQNRSSTPDTDDGYQSASDASRSDYSQQSSLPYDRRHHHHHHHYHHHSKDDLTINMLPSLMPKRISYAAAAKPIVASTNINNKISPSPIPIIKTKNNSSLIPPNEINNNNNNNLNGQKSKFIAPRFERMHHAKQYSSTTTTLTKDCSLSSSSTTNRTQIRSNHNQRHHVVHSSSRRR